ncbi:MAG: sugar transferase [Candidatus Marinimicrobia bacterium]|nr:sugar transferase [Candidatus Neomarinimicrobiota bacterium]
MGRSRKIGLCIKCFLDKVIAITGLIIASPIFLIVGIILKLQGEDIFYLQKRLGYLGKEFDAYKFTTMPKGSEKFGLITTTNDQRPDNFGKFLRKTKINELPQLINVLIGDMSLVGPRPLIKEQIAERLSELEIEEYYRMRPGVTGAGSLYFHHEDRLLASVEDPHKYYNEVIIPKKQQLEKGYTESWSLLLDFKIFVSTLKILLIDTLGIS